MAFWMGPQAIHAIDGTSPFVFGKVIPKKENSHDRIWGVIPGIGRECLPIWWIGSAAFISRLRALMNRMTQGFITGGFKYPFYRMDSNSDPNDYVDPPPPLSVKTPAIYSDVGDKSYPEWLDIMALKWVKENVPQIDTEPYPPNVTDMMTLIEFEPNRLRTYHVSFYFSLNKSNSSYRTARLCESN